MTNRNPVKQLFITFPKSTVDKHTFRDSLLKFSPDYYKVVEERHKDGTPHLHAIVRFKNKYSKSFVLKKFKEDYPNEYKRIDVKPVRSIKQSIKYLSKEDPNPLTTGEFISARNPQRNYLNSVARFFGFKSLEDLLTKEYRQQLKNHFTLEEHKYLQDLEHPYWRIVDQQKINKIISQNNMLLKDDITFIEKIIKNKYN